MQEIDLYFDKQTGRAKLIYALGIVWQQISTRLDSGLAKSGLNIAKFNILMIIKHAGTKEGIKQNEISRRLLVTASNITKLLDRLEKDGMITRNAKENDRRAKLIKITPEASKLLDDVWSVYSAEIETAAKKLKDEEAEKLADILIENLISVHSGQEKEFK